MDTKERRTFTEEFKREAVRLVETSGMTIKQVSEDLGIGLSTLTRWLRKYRDEELLSDPHDDVDKVAGLYKSVPSFGLGSASNMELINGQESEARRDNSEVTGS